MIKKSIFLIIATIFITQNIFGATINLEFFNENGLTSPSSTGTCTVGQKIGTLPEAPSKPGYKFTGWKVYRTCVSIIKNLVASTAGNMGYGYNWTEISGSGTKCKRNPDEPSSYPCSETPDLAGPGEWKTEFDYGTIYGEASCNATSGTVAVKTDEKFTKNTSTPTGTGVNAEKYCWCRVTGFTANPNPGEAYDYSNGAQCTVSSSAWVFRHVGSSVAYCAKTCAEYCANDVRRDPVFRGAVFGAVGE